MGRGCNHYIGTLHAFLGKESIVNSFAVVGDVTIKSIKRICLLRLDSKCFYARGVNNNNNNDNNNNNNNNNKKSLVRPI